MKYTEDRETGDLHLLVENTTSNRLESHIFDMLVLAVGVVPGKHTESIRQMVSLSKSPSGFLREAHPKLRPVDTPTKGVYHCRGSGKPKRCQGECYPGQCCCLEGFDPAS